MHARESLSVDLYSYRGLTIMTARRPRKRYGPAHGRGVYVHPSRGGFTQAELEKRRRAEAVKDLLERLAPLPYATRLAIQQEVSRSDPADFWKARSRAFRLINAVLPPL